MIAGHLSIRVLDLIVNENVWDGDEVGWGGGSYSPITDKEEEDFISR